MNLRPLLTSLFVIIAFTAFAQEGVETEPVAEETKKEKKEKKPKPPFYHHKWPSISVGAGVMGMMADDIRSARWPYSGTNTRMGYNAKIEYRPVSAVAVSLGALMGKVSDNHRTYNSNANVETEVLSAEFNVILPLDNNLIINRSSKFAPYLFAGFAYQWVSPRTDRYSANGELYHYWEDGTIRNQPYNYENTLGTAVVIQEDRIYETPLGVDAADSSKLSKTAMAIPFGLGFRWKFSNHFYSDISATYYWGLSDQVDGNSSNGTMTDHMFYTSVSFGYNIAASRSKPDSTQFDLIDFHGLDLDDDDEDGVRNIDDLCANTPSGAGVDEKGCPTDEDNDGVPDYKDDEAGSAPDAIVDLKGVTIGDEIASGTDTIAVRHNIRFLAYPSQKFKPNGNIYSLESPEEIYKASVDLGDYKDADLNGDGYISSDEITKAIDAFFEGELDYSASKLHGLIDFFFEQ